MVALKLSMRPASKELTFGWHRAEIIGTMISIIFLLTMTLWLLYEAVGRIVEPEEVKGLEMLITAILGLGFNLIQMKILHQGEGHYHLGGSHHHDHDHGHGGGCNHEGGDIEAHKCNNHIH